MSRNRSTRFTPLYVALGLVAGITIGTFSASYFSEGRLNIINTSSNKLNDLLYYIDDQYVDSVNISDLVEAAMPQILTELDPHSTYITSKEAEEFTNDLRGNFSGIGVKFVIHEDTIYISNVIKGGPSEKIGLKGGDRIISVDGKLFVGDSITNDLVMKTLKGPKDTEITLGIKRNEEASPLTFKIVRGDIPTKSIEASYMIDNQTGYIRIRRFGETTYPEMIIAMADLYNKGVKNLIIDLRGNLGGLMGSAIRMINEFLPKDRLIVYTEGRKSPREEYTSDGRGTYKNIPLVILVDESSASASEIFAGAIQDNDRGTIVGRRTFGKGLVQLPVEFKDGSMIRLTIARYYTPSGRSIQKPYEKGQRTEYEEDILTRFKHGEFFSQDSIKQEGPEYTTRMGRKVYGGGGIMPDLFVPQDTVGATSYYKEALMLGLVLRFAFDYTDKYRNEMRTLENAEAIEKYLRRKNIVDQFATYADNKGLKRRNLLIQKSRKLLEQALHGNIIYNMLDVEAYTEYTNTTDAAVLNALELFKQNKATPTPPPSSSTEEETESKSSK